MRSSPATFCEYCLPLSRKKCVNLQENQRIKMSTQAIDKNLLKSVLEEMLAERNPELKSVLEELLVKILSAKPATDREVPFDMEEIRRKYALRREAFAPLHQIFKDAPPASEMVKKLHK